MPNQPIDFPTSSEEAPFVLLPVTSSVFAKRAERFATLATDHSLADWLAFLGRLTAAQHEALQTLSELRLPGAAALEQARMHAMPLLNTTEARPEAWHSVVRQLVAALLPHAPVAARPALVALSEATHEQLEQVATRLLSDHNDASETSRLPIVAAALQVVWTALASRLDAAGLAPLDSPGLCPACGSPPVASIVRLSSGVNNLRYLHCSLCNSEWNVPRAVCTACGGDAGVAQQQIEGSSGAVRAETCDACKSYLKIFYQEIDPYVDPVADDLASLTLDILVDETGYGRSGPNFLFVPGDTLS